MGLFHKIFRLGNKAEQETEKAEMMNPNDIWFTMATVSNEFPQTEPKTKETEFDIFIHEDDYRQKEFLNVSSFPNIEEEFIGIRDIRINHSKKSQEYTLFKNCHVRKIIGSPNLGVDFNELKAILRCNSVGQVIINGEILRNGFSIGTGNTVYFGALSNDKVIELCIARWNENTASEIFVINKAFNLLFVNWHHCEIIRND